MHTSLSRVVGLALTPLALLALAAGRPAHAQTLTFEGLKDLQPVGDYYNGGGGPNYGISFTPNALALISNQAGGSGNFDAGAPPSPSTVLFFTSGNAATLNDAAGFSKGFSFYYTAIGQPGIINVYSGLNDTGTLLATLNLPVTPSPQYPKFQPFVPIGVTFNGVAQSVDFGGTENQIAFDNITINSATPGGTAPVPEASTTVSMGLLLALGLGGLVVSARRRKVQSH